MKAVAKHASQTEPVDTGLDKIQHAREMVMAGPPSAERSLRLATLADVEACWWESLSEHSQVRVYWRAALAAREHAQLVARIWRRRAARERAAPTAPTAAVAEVAR